MKEKDRRLAPRLGPSTDIIDAFDELFVIAHRSATLDGDLPTRAVQFCPPMGEGTAAGFHVVSPKNIVLSRAKNGAPRVGLPDSVMARVAGQARRVDRLVELGLLQRNGHWHRLLREKLYWAGDGDTVHLWTGHLVRPRPGVAIYATTAFNRRCAATLTPRLYQAGEWSPLVFELALPEAAGSAVVLQGDVACLLPVAGGATITKHEIIEEPDAGHDFNTFFDHEYLSPDHKFGRYRDLIKGELLKGEPEAHCKLVFAGPDLYDVGSLFAGRDIPAASVRSLTTVSGVHDGHCMLTKHGDIDELTAKLRRQWNKMFGKETLTGLRGISEYVYPPPQGRRELLIRPWLFMMTPPGWSTVIDAAQLPNVEGYRGILSTDKHFSIPFVLRIPESGSFTIPKNTRIGQLLPVPRQLLRTTFAMSRLDSLDSVERAVSLAM